MQKRVHKKLLSIYNTLYRAFGPRHWWPAGSAFEVIIGAVLTQNTAWSNVEKAVGRLKKENLLTPRRLALLNKRRLARLIRPAGYYNVKSERLRNFLKVLFGEFGGSLKRLFDRSTGDLRRRLLEINGIGPETADSILLYAANRPVFVVDAYTKRFLQRHGIIDRGATYDEVQFLFMENLVSDPMLFNEYHALIVELGKTYCRKKPLCHACPLNEKYASGKDGFWAQRREGCKKGLSYNLKMPIFRSGGEHLSQHRLSL